MRTYKDGKVAVTIMTYKMRHTHMLEYATLFNKDYDVYIVSQENDPAKEELKQFENERVKILYPSVTSIFQKRYWVLEWAKSNHYKYLVELDDDILTDMFYLDKDHRTATGKSLKVLTKKDALNELVDKMYSTIKEYNGGVCGPIIRSYLGMCPEKMLGKVYTSRMVTNVVILDVQKADNANICYDLSGDVSEDMDLNLQYLQEGYLCICLPDYGWSETDLNSWASGKSSTIYKNKKDVWHCTFGHSKKYHVSAILQKGRVSFVLKASKYFGTHKLPYIDPKLLELYELEDIDLVKEYLEDKGLVTDKVIETSSEYDFVD